MCFKMIPKNAQSRVCESQVRYLRTTHLGHLKFLSLLYLSKIVNFTLPLKWLEIWGFKKVTTTWTPCGWWPCLIAFLLLLKPVRLFLWCGFLKKNKTKQNKTRQKKKYLEKPSLQNRPGHSFLSAACRSWALEINNLQISIAGGGVCVFFETFAEKRIC